VDGWRLAVGGDAVVGLCATEALAVADPVWRGRQGRFSRVPRAASPDLYTTGERMVLREREALQSLRRDDEMINEAMATGEIHLGPATGPGDAGGDVDEGLAEPLPFPAAGLPGQGEQTQPCATASECCRWAMSSMQKPPTYWL
jgi:hypothetical protein